MYKAVFIDMDGTLLRKDHSVSLETRELLQKLIASDILVVMVSARPFHGIIPISAWLGTLSMPVVSLNGAYIGLNNKIIFESSIDLETITALRGHAMDHDVSLIYYTGLHWFSEVKNAAILKEQKITEVKVVVQPFESLMKTWAKEPTGVNKVMAIGHESVISSLELKLVSVFQSGLNIYTSKPTYLEMMRQDASKTKAVQFLMKRYGINREEIIAIGDNFNDKEMIAYAGTGVAMGNAPDVIKAVADYVTDTNQRDGVRKAIEKFIPL
jgi:Cof subfamily protein (haloacid dehalogenase superfamily)